MRSRIFDAPPAVVVGHRGMGRGVVGGHHENSVNSLLAAAQIASWVEFDVRRTADDKLVIGHQPALPDGTPVAAATADAAITAGMPALEDVLDRLPVGIGVNIDLKSALEDALRQPERTTAALLAPLSAQAGARRPLLVTSFDPAALDVLARGAPAVPRGLITWLWFPVGIAVAAAAGAGVEVLSVHVGSLEPNEIEPETQHPGVTRVVEVAHAAGLEVLAWCPDAAQVEALLDAGVDALCVNDLPAMAAALAPRGTSDL
ncbi:MAG: glycerophosphodiester phosphodiesterase [Jiangellaceae bacterium]